MPDQLQSIVRRMVEAGESEDNIALVIQHYRAPAAEPSAEPSAARSGSAFTTGSPVLDITRGLAGIGGLDEALGAAGAAGGGLLGGPGGSIAGSAAGGALGGALQRGLGGEGTTAGDAAWDAALGGVTQALPLGLGKLVGAAAKPIYKAALRPSFAVQEAGGDVAALGLKKGIAVTQDNALKLRGAIKAALARGQKPTAGMEGLATAMADATEPGGRQSLTEILTRIAAHPAAVSRLGIGAGQVAPAITRGGPNVARVLQLLLSGQTEQP